LLLLVRLGLNSSPVVIELREFFVNLALLDKLVHHGLSLDLGGQILLDVSLHVIGDHLFLDDDVLVFARPEARRNQLLHLYGVSELASIIVIHLVADLREEAFLLLLAVFNLILHMIDVTGDLFMQILHHALVESLLSGHIGLVAIQSGLPGLALHRVGVFYNARVHVRLQVAAIMKGFHDRVRSPRQPRARLTRLSIVDWMESTVLGRGAATRLFADTLAFGDQVILQISSHLT